MPRRSNQVLQLCVSCLCMRRVALTVQQWTPEHMYLKASHVAMMTEHKDETRHAGLPSWLHLPVCAYLV